MGMTPDEFFATFVLGNYFDFADEPGCVRRAFNAAIAASHMLDHYFEYCQRHDKGELKEYASRKAYMAHVAKLTNGSFQDIRSIANAYKHLYVGEREYSSISSAGDIEVLPIEGEDICEIRQDYEDDEVWFTRKTGERRKLLPCLKTVVDFWQAEVYGSGNR